VDYPKALSFALTCHKSVLGTTGGVGESFSVDHLIDVLEFRQVRHRRESYARVLRGLTFQDVRMAPVPYGGRTV
jgi:hypothetical protein